MQVLIGFSTTNSWLSRTIRWFTKAKCSHTFMVVKGSFLGHDMVIEAANVGFTMQTFEALQQKVQVVALIEPKVPLDQGIQWSLTQLEGMYNYGGLMGMSVVMLGRWLGKKWQNPFRRSKSLFCSEAAVDILQQSGYPGADKLSAPETSPEDLLEFLTGSH